MKVRRYIDPNSSNIRSFWPHTNVLLCPHPYPVYYPAQSIHNLPITTNRNMIPKSAREHKLVSLVITNILKTMPLSLQTWQQLCINFHATFTAAASYGLLSLSYSPLSSETWSRQRGGFLSFTPFCSFAPLAGFADVAPCGKSSQLSLDSFRCGSTKL
jgi:hypothetical protein